MTETELEPWQRPPFEEGHDLSTTHGAYSPALVEPRAREISVRIFDVHPQLNVEQDGDAVARLAMNHSRIERTYKWLNAQEDAVFANVDKGIVHGLYERLERWERFAIAAEEKLGMSPAARARLGLDTLKARELLSPDEKAEQAAARKRLDDRMAALDGEAEEEDA